MTTHQARVAVVTGAASGIGAAIADQLIAAGVHVALLDKNVPASAAAVHRSDASGHGDAMLVPCDVRDDLGVASAIDRVATWRNRIDVVVNAAGVLVRSDIAATTPQTWQDVLDINLTGTFRVVQATLPYLVDPATAGTKRLINIGSGAADRGYAYPAYTASKGGVVAMTRQMAAELAPHGVTVNAINPGFIRTAINDDAWSDSEVRTRWEKTIPLGRMGRAEEVAAVACFLASPSASYVTGQTIAVDGGRGSITAAPV